MTAVLAWQEQHFNQNTLFDLRVLAAADLGHCLCQSTGNLNPPRAIKLHGKVLPEARAECATMHSHLINYVIQSSTTPTKGFLISFIFLNA